MEADLLSHFSAASKRRQAAPRYDGCSGFDEVEGGEDESRPEFACPFCCEDFDIVGLCFHIDDEHPVEAKNGACPVCDARIGMDIVGHITAEHANIFKVQRKRRYPKGSYSTLSLPRKDLHEGALQSFLGCSSATSSVASDPLLSFCTFNSVVVDSSEDIQPEPLNEAVVVDQFPEEKLAESAESSPLGKDFEECAQRSQFVRQLVLSAMFDDDIMKLSSTYSYIRSRRPEPRSATPAVWIP